ncbi:UDP-N-acetylmuramate dehydrogenase [Occallatibacter savannae]|uniref:UDP-N-acetylmuramate dehydrogenase n=1 Tax=Occallatibacter savannae TaxID=1002691 RepID=UPI000D69D073|nr:UDP-N-acetylmuramate dehydrogenase [Occallatibacter savannae]
MRIEENRELGPLTTLGVGGPARWFAEPETEDEVLEAVKWATAGGVPLFVLGGGSNLLVADAGFNGVVIKLGLKGVHVAIARADWERYYTAAAGEDWDTFVQRTVEENSAGLECLAGIPGTVGGTPVQNVGAYGQEVASTIYEVRALDLERNEIADFRADECAFAYRRSRFNTADRGRFVILSVVYRLTRGGSPILKYADVQREFPGESKPSLTEVAEAVRRIRRSKGMLLVEGDADCRSAGSFFKNPVIAEEKAAEIARIAGAEPPRFPAGPEFPAMMKISAAWLMERSGFCRGFRLGRAAISSKHTLALVNLGGATAAEILALAHAIRTAVSAKFSIDLEIEPVLIGF